MEPTTEILREELLAAREKVRTQIDRLRARPYPVAAIGPIGTVMFGAGAPFRTNGVMIDNDALIARLTETLRQIEECLAGLRWDEA
jgi:hypothetical protein